MSEKIKGLRQALAACRESNRNLKQHNEHLVKIIRESDMKGMETVLSLESNYFGGIFDRLGQVSRWLTAIAWHKYPDESFQDLHWEINQFSPYITELMGKHGITFAVLAPNEPEPSENGMWQLVHNCQDLKRERQYDDDGYEVFPASMREVRVYLTEMFFDIPSSESDRLAVEVEKHYKELEEATQKFSEKVICEVSKELQDLMLSLEKLQSVA